MSVVILLRKTERKKTRGKLLPLTEAEPCDLAYLFGGNSSPKETHLLPGYTRQGVGIVGVGAGSCLQPPTCVALAA
jgi:hypothetical protein